MLDSRRALLPQCRSGGHKSCKGARYSKPGEQPVRCTCGCHATFKPTLAEAVATARRARMLAAGVDPDEQRRGREGRQFCRHDHEMTEENTGPRGECRACKREASQRCKARRAERERKAREQ